MKITDPDLLKKLKQYTRIIAHKMNAEERAELARAKPPAKKKAYTSSSYRASKVRESRSKYTSGPRRKTGRKKS